LSHLRPRRLASLGSSTPFHSALARPNATNHREHLNRRLGPHGTPLRMTPGMSVKRDPDPPSDASALMKQGIAWLNENTEASLTAALHAFDAALAMRRAILQPEDHWMAYLTAASWMNRGCADAPRPTGWNRGRGALV